MKIIRGLTEEQTRIFLAKAGELIELNESKYFFMQSSKFRKSKCQYGLKETGLECSIVRDESGNYFVLGDRKMHFLGKGRFSEVRIVYPLLKQDNQWNLGDEMAVKELKGGDLYFISYIKFSLRKWREFNSLHQYEDTKSTKLTWSSWKGQKKFYMFTELVEGKNLRNRYIQNTLTDLSLVERIEFMLSLFKQLIDLHENKHVVHCDIKPENIIYNTSVDGAKNPLINGAGR